MNKDSARKLVRETLQDSFDKERFIYFIKNLLNSIDASKTFSYHGSYIPEIFRDHINKYERVGQYTDAEGNRLDILIVYLAKETTLERARTAQRNFIARYLKDRGEKDAGLIAFVSPDGEWRFSFVKMEYKFMETPKGDIKAKEEFTPARRYSYLVGSNENSHTAQSRFAPILSYDENSPTLKELEEAFSVEKVTREFFGKYRELYLSIRESLDEIVKNADKIKADFKGKGVDTVDFAKKLLGQIVFLYFLQKKGWFGVKRGEEWGSGSKRFLRELFEEKHGNCKNFFNDILEPLFYEALRSDRSANDDYFSQFNCRIPFLNGGLFDPINEYDWVNTDILIPDELFSNGVKTKEGDTGTGVLDVFDRYNFTVKEDEPLEREVAIDPEMLGKVFENLLEVKDRKSKGTYYTPREIVHYMCEQSLINYLSTELEGKVSKEDIDTLIKYGETAVEHDSRVVNEGRETGSYSFKLPQSIRDNARVIDEKFASMRVCDPAAGSGAFLVGMMNEIIRARNALTPYINSSTVIASEVKQSRTPYHFKRHAIQNCLYGVDIDPSAVEIAKLRLWLSLMVDEEDIKQIKPLPNLDYKIVQGNSLLGVERNLLNYQQFNKLEELKRDYFNETSASKKQAYKKQIEELISQITNGHKDFDFEVYFSEVFHEKNIEKNWKAYHITWVTHNSRVSERMKEYQAVIQHSRRNKGVHPLVPPVELDDSAAIEVTEYITQITREDGLRVLAYNICRDHVHMILVCEEAQRDNIIRKLKGKSAQLYKQHHGITEEFHLWAQKYSATPIEDDEQMVNTMQYIHYNREKHNLHPNKGLQPLVGKMLTPLEKAFAPIVEKGGFDVVIANPPYVRQEEIKDQKSALQKQKYEVYNATSDLYTYFYERSYNILKNKGILTFISSNKWMRAEYGEKIRRFFLERTKIMQLIDFNGHRVFEASVDTNIIILQRGEVAESYFVPFVNIQGDFTGETLDIYLLKHQRYIELKELRDSGWCLVDEQVLRIKEKIEKAGTVLKNWDINIYRGIVTGLNKAFVIDTLTKARLFKEDPKSAETLKPLLRGRDIGRYHYQWQGLWLIKIESGWTDKNRGSEKPEEFCKKTYPAIYSYFLDIEQQIKDGKLKIKGKGLRKRDDQGKHWWELRNCDYYQEFEKEKIVYTDIAQRLTFTLDDEGYFLPNAAYFITGNHFKYLIGILNSDLLDWYYRFISSQLGSEGIRHFSIYIEQLPIPKIPEKEQRPLIDLVDKILAITKDDDYSENPAKQAKVREYENQIDELVYNLYGLTKEEIKVVENYSRK